MFEWFGTNFESFPLLGPGVGGLISAAGFFGLGRLALSVLGLPFLAAKEIGSET